MIDENEVGLKVQPEDTRYVKKCRPTLPSVAAADSEMGRVVAPWRALGGGELHTQAHHIPRDVTPWILSWWEQVWIAPIFGVPNLFAVGCC